MLDPMELMEFAKLSPCTILQFMMIILLNVPALLASPTASDDPPFIGTLSAPKLTQETRNMVPGPMARANRLPTLATALPAAFPLMTPVLTIGLFAVLPMTLATARFPRRKSIGVVPLLPETTTRWLETQQRALAFLNTRLRTPSIRLPCVPMDIPWPRLIEPLRQKKTHLSLPLTPPNILPIARPPDLTAKNALREHALVVR